MVRVLAKGRRDDRRRGVVVDGLSATYRITSAKRLAREWRTAESSGSGRRTELGVGFWGTHGKREWSDGEESGIAAVTLDPRTESIPRTDEGLIGETSSPIDVGTDRRPPVGGWGNFLLTARHIARKGGREFVCTVKTMPELGRTRGGLR